MYKLCFYVPVTHIDAVKQAIFDAGAGKMGHYKECCWQTKGEGHFVPLKGSQPHIGTMDEHTVVEEYKVETLCETSILTAVIHAFKQAHPYETPAFDVYPLTL